MNEQTQKALHWRTVGYVSEGAKAWIEQKLATRRKSGPYERLEEEHRMPDIIEQAEAIAARAERIADDRIILRYLDAFDCGDFDTMCEIFDTASPELQEIIYDCLVEMTKDEPVSPEALARNQQMIEDLFRQYGEETK